jgi:nitrous oxidase accessory protein NosD
MKSMKRKCLAIGIILLFIGTCIIPANAQNTEKPLPVSRGDWLYVGGSGPGNYSKIQDAINESSNGGTIFVYDDSSPYYENIIIEKSITLKGENRATTVILGDGSGDDIIVNISADDVSISGFTIQPYMGHPTGIAVYKNYTGPDFWKMEDIQNVTIADNIIRDAWRGIYAVRLNHGMIIGNTVEHSVADVGIYLLISSNSTIASNFVTNCLGDGILIDGMWSLFNIKTNRLYPKYENISVFQNTVTSNRWGIEVNSGPVNTKIYENNITDNHELGINIVFAWKTEIIRNNFINNYNNAYFYIDRFTQLLKNSWNNNYWGESRNVFVAIHGTFAGIFSLIVFDWHPAKEPYDIPGMS